MAAGREREAKADNVESERFDTLAKVMNARTRTRRSAIHAVTGGAIGAVLGTVDLANVEAKKKRTPPPAPGIPASAKPDPICAGRPSCCSTLMCGDDCICQTTVEGGGFCLKLGATGCGDDCTSSAQCPGGVCTYYGTAANCNPGVTCCGGRVAACTSNSSRCGAA